MSEEINPRIKELAAAIVNKFITEDELLTTYGVPQTRLTATGSAYVTIAIYGCNLDSPERWLVIRVADHNSVGYGWDLDLRPDEDFETVWPKVERLLKTTTLDGRHRERESEDE
jgi:hypothetical protein